MDWINYIISLTSDINLDKLLTTHKYIIAGGWAVLKIIAVAHPGVDSNKIIDLFKLIKKGNGK